MRKSIISIIFIIYYIYIIYILIYYILSLLYWCENVTSITFIICQNSGEKNIAFITFFICLHTGVKISHLLSLLCSVHWCKKYHILPLFYATTLVWKSITSITFIIYYFSQKIIQNCNNTNRSETRSFLLDLVYIWNKSNSWKYEQIYLLADSNPMKSFVFNNNYHLWNYLQPIMSLDDVLLISITVEQVTDNNVLKCIEHIGLVVRMSIFDTKGWRFEPQHQYVFSLSKRLYPHCFSRLSCEMSTRWGQPREGCSVLWALRRNST